MKELLAKKYGYKDFETFEDKLTFGRETEVYNALKMINTINTEHQKELLGKAKLLTLLLKIPSAVLTEHGILAQDIPD